MTTMISGKIRKDGERNSHPTMWFLLKTCLIVYIILIFTRALTSNNTSVTMTTDSYLLTETKENRHGIA